MMHPHPFTLDPQRRALLARALVGSAAAQAALHWPRSVFAQTAGGKPLPAYADWKAAQQLIVHSPTTIETVRSALGEHLLTPAQILYIRNNLQPPPMSIVADPMAWSVAVEGVRRPRTMTMAELQRLGTERLTMVLQCSGNGRAFFPHDPSGTQWTVGACGNVRWTGVPLAAVAEALGGVIPGNDYITGTGGETIPAGIDRASVVVERSVPVSELRTAMLAWELNGAPIPLAHGGPLRLVVPGYTGVNSVKYVKRIAFTPMQSPARIQTERYRMVPLGAEPGPQYPSVWAMEPKSIITRPAGNGGPMPAGRLLIEGVAFGGTAAARSVAVSLDGGKSWSNAPFIGLDLGRFAWRQFVLPVRLQPGSYVLASRVTDMQGRVQPAQRQENRSGYVNNSWRDHAVQIRVA